MVRTPVSVFSSGQSKPTLEIKPTSPFVVFYGNANEAQDAEVAGTLVLSNPDSSLAIRGVKITLTGIRKVSWVTNTATPQPVVSKRTFLKDEQILFPTDGTKSKTHKIAPGEHEWQFKFKLPSNTEESVEGLLGSHIIYMINAVVDRGKLAKDLVASKHIRVIRTLGQDHTETTPLEQINEDIWANKIVYKITVPQRNYIVGTSMTADFVLCPLRKGVTIGNIKMEVLEHMVLHNEHSGRMLNHTRDLVVAQREMELPETSRVIVPEDEEDTDRMFDESYRFRMTLDLPKSLKVCRQSVDTEFIRIVHKLRLYVNIHNPEGHTSQLLVKNHINLFISPHLPPSDDQTVNVDQRVLASQAAETQAAQTAPPAYEEHQLDELYREIDTSGFMTPAPRGTSGANTPFYGLSRNPSDENLHASLDAVAQDTGACAQQLSNRLYNLSIGQGQGRSSGNGSSSRGSPHYSPGTTTPHSAGPSIDDHSPHSRFQHSPGGGSANQDYFTSNSFYDMEALSRTPSYNTAVRTPGGRIAASEGLPTYAIATSRPPSPIAGSSRSNSSRNSHSPARSIDTLREETERNTMINSRRGS